MKYSRQALTECRKNPEYHQLVIQDLLQMLSDGVDLSIAEAREICGGLRLLRNQDGVAGDIKASSFKQCDDVIFMDKYLLYYQNHEGEYPAMDFNGIIGISEKREDIKLLNAHYSAWVNDVIDNGKLSNELLRHIAIETYRQIKELKRYVSARGINFNRFKHMQKGIILHSKFLYLTILEYYQDGNVKEEVITICNNKFVVDSFVYVHVLFRHYAEVVKSYQKGKSYHPIDGFNYKILPKVIYEILEKFKSVVNCANFDDEKLFFTIKNKPYAIWYKRIKVYKKNTPPEFVMQIQTLYPVDQQRDFDKIAKLNEVKIDDFTFFLS